MEIKGVDLFEAEIAGDVRGGEFLEDAFMRHHMRDTVFETGCRHYIFESAGVAAGGSCSYEALLNLHGAVVIGEAVNEFIIALKLDSGERRGTIEGEIVVAEYDIVEGSGDIVVYGTNDGLEGGEDAGGLNVTGFAEISLWMKGNVDWITIGKIHSRFTLEKGFASGEIE
jgi:hypothetical protein